MDSSREICLAVITGKITKVLYRQIIPLYTIMEDEDEAYEIFLNSLSINGQLNEYDRYVSNPISQQ